MAPEKGLPLRSWTLPRWHFPAGSSLRRLHGWIRHQLHALPKILKQNRRSCCEAHSPPVRSHRPSGLGPKLSVCHRIVGIVLPSAHSRQQVQRPPGRFRLGHPAPPARHEEAGRFPSASFRRRKSCRGDVLPKHKVPVVGARFGPSLFFAPIASNHLDDAFSGFDGRRVVLREVQANAIRVRPEFGSGCHDHVGLMAKQPHEILQAD